MPNSSDVEDKGTLGHSAAATGFDSWFKTLKKHIVRCGFYEKHHQHLKCHQTCLLLNMFDNFVSSTDVDLSGVRTEAGVRSLILDMLRFYGALWYWDPSYQDPMAERQCDLFKISRDQVQGWKFISLTQNLGFTICFGSQNA